MPDCRGIAAADSDTQKHLLQPRLPAWRRTTAVAVACRFALAGGRSAPWRWASRLPGLLLLWVVIVAAHPLPFDLIASGAV